MSTFSASELSFLRSVPPYTTSYKPLIVRYFENDTRDGWGLVGDICKAYGEPEFITRCAVNDKLPWKHDDYCVVEQRYGDFPSKSAFELYGDVIQMLENEKILKLFRELQKNIEVKISEQQKAAMQIAFNNEKIEIAEFFLLPRPKGKYRKTLVWKLESEL